MMIRLRDVSLHYGKKAVLDHFSLELPAEGATCLLGPSGCGKTTLLRLLGGLIQPQSGKLEGLPTRPGFLFQEDRLLPTLDILGNIMAVTTEKNARHWLEQVGLGKEAHALPGELSGGMRRRAALARALAYDCDLLLLDEPFTGLNPELVEAMSRLCRARGLPILAVTHTLRDAELLGARTLHFTGPPLTCAEV